MTTKKQKFYIKPISQGSTKPNEHNDCAVRAVANVTGKPYQEIHWLFEKHGRQYQKAVCQDIAISAMQELGFEPVVLESNNWAFWTKTKKNPKRTLNQVVKDLPKGKFVLYVRGHATCLIDGEIVDTFEQSKSKPVEVVWWHPEISFK